MMFGVVAGPGLEIDTLIVIDPESGSGSPVGSTGYKAIGAIALDNTGSLYGIDSFTDLPRCRYLGSILVEVDPDSVWIIVDLSRYA